jgi:uncharacterized protein (DUF2236 family)
VARTVGLSEVLAGFPRVHPGRPGDPGLLPPDSVVRRINSETALLFGGQRALLLQIAHPDVAAGVFDHSDFRRSPFERLWRTLGTMLDVTFGDSERSTAAAARVGAIHASVRGTRSGNTYDARDPELLFWVHATIVDTGLRTYERFVGPLPGSVRERYYQDMTLVASAFGVPDEAQPGTFDGFQRYLGEALGRLRVTDEALSLAEGILYPTVPVSLRPVAASLRLATAGLLPGRIREAYALKWSSGHMAALATLAASSRAVVGALPDGLRRWPHAAEALGRMGEEKLAAG